MLWRGRSWNEGEVWTWGSADGMLRAASARWCRVRWVSDIVFEVEETKCAFWAVFTRCDAGSIGLVGLRRAVCDAL